MCEHPATPRAINLIEGFGGVLNFDAINECLSPSPAAGSATTARVRHLGTVDLVTCVGVYVPLENKRFFVAHIDARGGEISCTDSQGEELKDLLLDRLQRLVGGALKACKDTTRSLRIVYNKDFWTYAQANEGRHKITGNYVIEALTSFFGNEQPEKIDAKGFIIGEDGQCESLTKVSDNDSKKFKDHGYTGIDAKQARIPCDWKVRLRRDSHWRFVSEDIDRSYTTRTAHEDDETGQVSTWYW